MSIFANVAALPMTLTIFGSRVGTKHCQRAADGLVCQQAVVRGQET